MYLWNSTEVKKALRSSFPKDGLAQMNIRRLKGSSTNGATAIFITVRLRLALG
jgi:hypothetical protein